MIIISLIQFNFFEAIITALDEFYFIFYKYTHATIVFEMV